MAPASWRHLVRRFRDALPRATTATVTEISAPDYARAGRRGSHRGGAGCGDHASGCSRIRAYPLTARGAHYRRGYQRGPARSGGD